MATTPGRLRTRNRVILSLVLLVILWITTQAALGPKIRVLRAERRPLVQRVVANGRVHVPVRIRLGTQIGGVVEHLLVDRGDHVRPRDLLLDLANAEMQAGVAQRRPACNRCESWTRRPRPRSRGRPR